jgi:integrase
VKTRKGSVKADNKGRLIARFTFTDQHGTRHDLRRVVTNKTAGWQTISDFIRELENTGGTSLTTDIRTFAQLADEYEKTELIEPRYVNGKKIKGLRTYKNLKGTLKVLRAHFGNKPIREITYRQVEKFKSTRFETPIVLLDGTERHRSVASVNRELSLLRRMFKVAVQEGWLPRDPFMAGKSLISLSDEVIRERILSTEEENRLIAWASAEERSHLRPVVICALDTGMRRGEIMSLRWSDVDLEKRSIEIQALNTKTLKDRTVPISERLATELVALRAGNTERVFANERVFNVGSFRRAWKTACRLAKIENIHFHDLRATFATRMIDAGMAEGLVAKMLGHSTTVMTRRIYTRTDEAIIQKAANLLNERAG